MIEVLVIIGGGANGTTSQVVHTTQDAWPEFVHQMEWLERSSGYQITYLRIPA